jgi:CheY-like chemotaxis protein
MFRVLLVDDESAILRLLRAVLEPHGFAVTTAASAAEAISLLAPDKYDIVLTDLRMETPLAGFEVVAAADQLVPRPLIVILTAFPVPSADWKFAGADLLRVKGMNTVLLPEQLKKLLQPPADSDRRNRPVASGE